MSPSIIVPITAQGTIIDTNIDVVVSSLSTAPFTFTDVFIYSHGWWTTANAALVDYARFSTGLAAILIGATAGPRSALEIGLHWPSTVSEDNNLLTNIIEPFTFFNRAQMANTVGENGAYSLIRLILEAHPPGQCPKFHLLGHSFGAKVVCSALQALAADAALSSLLTAAQFNVVLLQAAFDNDSFQSGQAYADIIPGIPKLRFMASTSSLDAALNSLYPDAQRLVNLFSDPVPAMGAAGPALAMFNQLKGATVSVGAGYAPPAASLSGRLIVADLSPLHQNSTAPSVPFVGHHSDIFHDEIYRLISCFLFGSY